MTQRIDIIVDGKTINSNQRSDSDQLWTRIRSRAQTARLVEIRRHVVAPTPTPVPPPAVGPYECICHMAQKPLEALKAPAHYKVWFTADPAYDEWATRANADACRAQGREVGVWFVPTQVTLERAKVVAARLGTTHITGEAETAEQFDASWNYGLRAVIGNLSALRDDQRAKVASGEMAFVLEHYWNTDPGLVLDFMHLPVASIAVACYDAHGELPGLQPGWAPRLHDYLSTPGHWVKGAGVYGPGMTDADWALLP